MWQLLFLGKIRKRAFCCWQAKYDWLCTWDKGLDTCSEWFWICSDYWYQVQIHYPDWFTRARHQWR